MADAFHWRSAGTLQEAACVLLKRSVPRQQYAFRGIPLSNAFFKSEIAVFHLAQRAGRAPQSLACIVPIPFVPAPIESIKQRKQIS